MAGQGSSMLYSFLLFTVILSLQEVYRGKLASSEWFTILGGFTSSLLFLISLTFIGNFQEASGMKTGWGAVIVAEVIALIAASTVHRVCITTCFLFSAGLLYEDYDHFKSIWLAAKPIKEFEERLRTSKRQVVSVFFLSETVALQLFNDAIVRLE
ncbi:hypothetical protein SAY86_010128 [Trapa natans]|uniref:Dolichyl-diphosphooligosaccharide--protein glycosyltransferase subunit KCP2 n=1 Tax=Trapa natans TaxID=22666 RepID=A0AAN7L2Z4_TRANT|nr:hypothetical protein SAY86_010128 [Trapa natans]